MSELNDTQILEGYQRPKRPTLHHEFKVSVVTSEGRTTAEANLAKVLDKHNQEIIARGFRPNMGVIPE